MLACATAAMPQQAQVIDTNMCSAAGWPPYPDGSPKAGDHLRKILYRMGFNDEKIVALSGGLLPMVLCRHVRHAPDLLLAAFA